MKFNDEQNKEISAFLDKKIKKCPICYGRHFELFNGIDYQYRGVEEIIQLIPFILFTCINCGFMMQFLAISSGLFKFDDDQSELFWYKDVIEKPMGQVLPFKK